MTLRLIPALMAAMLCLASCSDYGQPQSVPEQEEHTYSFTAVLPGIDTRMSYQEDPKTGNLKMVWDEGDVIRLYPDPLMNDTTEYYEFVANTGAGTSHTVFVHQGYIHNWEHWSGKAIYLFPNGDNLDVSHNSTEFLAKAYVQKKNGDKEHLKYAEHVLGQDGSKQYTEYWSQNLVDANLKHDHQMTFAHKHTVVYKVMLRGFIFDIPGGSQLKMSGDAWDGEETILTLGSKDDEEPFLKVGEYGKDNYEDNVLTAYIIRQVDGDVDGAIKKGEKLRFELLTYDKLDGTVMPLDPDDTMRNGNPEYSPDYFTNLPWGEEYTWDVTATADIEYRAGDYVVADLTDKSKDYAYPKVAVDLGLPLKWAAFNVGAKKIDDKGEYVVFGHTGLYPQGSDTMVEIYDGEWTSGNPLRDAATANWGNEWRTPTFKEYLDLLHYATWDGSKDEPLNGNRWKEDLEINAPIYHMGTNPFHEIGDLKMLLVKSNVNDKYIYLPAAGFIHNRYQEPYRTDKVVLCTSSSKMASTSDPANNTMVIYLYQYGFSFEHYHEYAIVYCSNRYGNDELIKAESLRAVKYR